MKTTQVIFLDVDGVLNRVDKNNDWILASLRAPGMEGNAVVELNMVKALEHVLAQIPWVKIVVSSTWRTVFTEKDLFASKIFINKGLFHEDWRTEELLFNDRGKEISNWLEVHPEVTQYAVIDDNENGICRDHKAVFVHTDPIEGLTMLDLIKLVKPFGYKVNYDLSVSVLGGPAVAPVKV